MYAVFGISFETLTVIRVISGTAFSGHLLFINKQ